MYKFAIMESTFPLCLVLIEVLGNGPASYQSSMNFVRETDRIMPCRQSILFTRLSLRYLKRYRSQTAAGCRLLRKGFGRMGMPASPLWPSD